MKTKYYISTDIEGLACVVGTYGEGIHIGSHGYDFACKEAVRETNAAVRALFDNGATEVIVWDSHGTGVNFDYTELDPRVKISIGAGSKQRFAMLDDDFGGVLYIGAHAYDTPKAVLAHVYSSATFQYVKINGDFVGEMQIDSAIAAKHGVPCIFASGDDVCVGQAKASFGDIASVITKTGLAWNQCISRHPEEVCKDIYAEVSRAVKMQDAIKPYAIKEPLEIEIRYKRIEYAQGCSYLNPDGTPFEFADSYTRKGKLKKITDYFA